MSTNIFFTSDTHYGHTKVIEYASRPFTDSHEMDEAMIARWNAIVRPGDLVYHLGDFALSRPEHAVKTVRRLMGNKYLVFGNHDKRLRKDVEFLGCWVWSRDLTQIEVGDQKITLCHYAMRTWNQVHRGAWQLYGHSHGSLTESAARSTDVGVDCWDYAPVPFEALQKLMVNREHVPVDHHAED